MNTSILSIALASSLLVGNNVAPSWQTSYFSAQSQVASQKKPMVVVFGTGANGWAKVVRSESPSPEVSKILAEQYVCVYVDTSAPEGQKLASNFAINGGVGFVISDRTGGSQAFWHQGDMSNGTLAQYLRKYADPTVAVVQTETVNSVRTSYYPATPSYQGTIRSANC